jgi:uncharacterized protein YciI
VSADGERAEASVDSALEDSSMSDALVRALVAFALLAAAVPLPAAAAETEAEHTMTTYQLVLLRQGGKAPELAEHQAARTQRAHLDHQRRMLEGGKLLAWGPVEGAGSLREVLVLSAETEDEAKDLLHGDPRVANGELEAEILEWHAADGILHAGDPDRLVPALFGLFVRPPDAPGLPEHRQRELQQGHLANIQRMADLGDLVIAGPLGGDGRLRGVLVFRTSDLKRARALVEADPAVQAGRLALELYRWNVPAGTLPEAR